MPEALVLLLLYNTTGSLPDDVEQTEHWFIKYGDWTVFLERLIPIFRSPISTSAGIERMNLWLFMLFTTVALSEQLTPVRALSRPSATKGKCRAISRTQRRLNNVSGRI